MFIWYLHTMNISRHEKEKYLKRASEFV
jgi:hypothetical protein